MWEIGRTCPLISAIFRDRCDQRGWSRWILGFSSKKEKKKKEKKERTSSFRGSFEERETMLLDEKQLGGREMWEIGKGNDRGRGKYASGSNVDGDAIDYDLWRGNARIDGPTDVLRFGKIWCGENLDVTRDRWDGKFFEIPPPFIPCFWSFLSWMIITRIASPVLIDLVNARLSFLNSYKTRDNYARLLIYLSFSGDASYLSSRGKLNI